MTDAAADWGPKALRGAVARLAELAAACPVHGITMVDVMAELPEFGEDVGEVVLLAVDVGRLLRVRRLSIDAGGVQRGEWRYFAIGRRA